MKAEVSAKSDLQKAWLAYRRNRTPESQAEYLRALNAYSKLISGRE